ncbi:hypothetical protein Q5P01_010652 [Channa striata]|uniref:Uncharacterized protein n=1 Tax=Channa striata TaxID=64152 RepID=A0AA88MVG3_CHASR|nr:hypothetical protein Q5P01_010652 [Channa striata]
MFESKYKRLLWYFARPADHAPSFQPFSIPEKPSELRFRPELFSCGCDRPKTPLTAGQGSVHFKGSS